MMSIKEVYEIHTILKTSIQKQPQCFYGAIVEGNVEQTAITVLVF